MNVDAKGADELAVTRVIADATRIVGGQAEASAAHSALAIGLMAESVYAVSEALPLHPATPPADRRRARLYARRVRRYTQSVAEEAAILEAAQRDLSTAIQFVMEATAASPTGQEGESSEKIREVLSRAIAAAKRAERAARIIREHLWQSIQAAIEAARLTGSPDDASRTAQLAGELEKITPSGLAGARE